MKKVFLVFAVFLLAGCVEQSCPRNWEVAEPEKWERVFNSCLEKTAKARSGTNYSTNDDEDWDEVVSACSRAASNVSRSVYVESCPISEKDKP